jgi:hypothetical protein
MNILAHGTHRARCLFAALVATLSGPTYADDYVFVDSFESSDCSQPLSCSGVAGACVSGQITDAASASPLRARFNIGLGCGGGAIGGPCDLSIAAYDPIAFAANPGAATPLAVGETTLDGCGRYRFANVSLTAGVNRVAVVTRDAPAGTTYVPAEAFHALAGTQHVDGLTAIAARIDDVTAWAPTGQNFVSSGVLLLTFSTSGTLTAGVSVSGTGTAFYFSDVDAQRYFTDPVATATGANGSALFVGSATSVSGGESGGCSWPAFPLNFSSISGVVTYAEFMCQ